MTDEDLVDAEWVPGWEDPRRYDTIVDLIACEVLGHKVRHYKEQVFATTYAWSYCTRCGAPFGGRTPPLNHLWSKLVDLEVRRPGINAIITDIRDVDLGGP